VTHSSVRLPHRPLLKLPYSIVYFVSSRPDDTPRPAKTPVYLCLPNAVLSNTLESLCLPHQVNVPYMSRSWVAPVFTCWCIPFTGTQK
jgi:hypothetical protein